MSRISDYKIVEYRTTREPDVIKYQVKSGGQIETTCSSFEAAVVVVKNLLRDPWFYDR